jgi:ABC-type glycerol-3-phosphate transport system permease component
MIHLILLFFTFFPFYFLIISSVKTNKQILDSYFLPVMPFHFENYVKAFEKVIYYLYNSMFVCVITAIGVALISCISAYVYARFEFPGKSILFMILLSFLMLPSVLTIIPSFLLIAKLRLVNNHWGLILPYIASGQITFIFILRTFIEQIPRELFESAQMDGASHVKVFAHIVAPLSKPMLISLMLLNFLGNWNDFAWPLLVLSKESMKTVTVGLYAFMDIQQVQYGYMFAGFIIASVPLIILFTLNMNSFIKGITSGAVKG